MRLENTFDMSEIATRDFPASARSKRAISEHAQKPSVFDKNWKILDLGCSYGPVGITMAKIFPDAGITMTDINTRAIQLAKMNIKLNHVANAEVIFSDLYKSIEGKFNTIIVNPPQKAGKETCFEIIEKSIGYLEPNGSLQLVARHNKGGKGLEKKMNLVFLSAWYLLCEVVTRKPEPFRNFINVYKKLFLCL